MTLTIDLPPATLAKLEAEAKATGKDVQTVVLEAVEARFARRRKSFAEVLKPIHDAVDASGMGEQELEKLAEDAVAATRAEQRGNRVVRESYGAAASRRNCRFIALTLAR